MINKMTAREQREKIIKEEQDRMGSRISNEEFEKLLLGLEGSDEFEGIEGIEGNDLVDRKSIKVLKTKTPNKKPVTCRFTREKGTLVQVKIKDHLNVTKEMKIKARKKKDIRSGKIKKAQKAEKAMLERQRKTLPTFRQQTPKLLSKIEKKVEKAEMQALREMVVERLAEIMAVRKIDIEYSCRSELMALSKSISKITNEMIAKTVKLRQDFKKESLNNLVYTFLANYFLTKYKEYSYKACDFNSFDHDLPRVASHNIIMPEKITSKPIKPTGTNVEVIEGLEENYGRRAGAGEYRAGE